MTISYELAKQLKDAGWSQSDPYGEYTFIDNSNVERFSDELKLELNPCKIPTLSELIEACGGKCDFTLYRRGSIWTACWISKETGITQDSAEGLTPEEAVAKLWLELNKKETVV